jgi:hypothetical protein
MLPNNADINTQTVNANGGMFSPLYSSQSLFPVYATGGTGGFIWKPNGVGSTTGQMTLSATGSLAIASDLLSGGTISALQNFASTTTATVLATTGAGTVYLRPNGTGSTTGQFTLDSNGHVAAVGRMDVAGGIRGSGLIPPTFASGAGVEVYYTGSAGYVLSFNRTAVTYQPLNLIGSQVNVLAGATTVATATAASFAVTGESSGTSLKTDQNISSSTTALVLGTTGAGTVYLRPNGVGSGTGQVYIDASGGINSVGGYNNTMGAAAFNTISLTNTSGVQVLINANGNTEGNIRTVTNHPLSFSTNNTERMAISAAGVVSVGGLELGYRKVNFTAQNTNYTFVAADAGKGIEHTDTTARSYTVDNSVFAKGDIITVANFTGTGAVSILAGAGVTLYLAGTATTGTRTVAVRGIATILFESASVAYVSGPGVT